MIYLVYGENESENLKSISSIISKLEDKKFSKIKYIELEEISPSEFISKTTSSSLFGDKELFAVKISNARIKKEYTNVIEKFPQNEEIVFYINKKLDTKKSTLIKLFQSVNSQIIFNKKEIYDNIFTFTDNLFLKNRKKTYEEFKKIEEVKLDEVYVFTMIMYGLRNLSMAVYNSESYLKQPFFKKQTIDRQKKLYTTQSIKKIYEEFYKLENQIKHHNINKKIIVFNAIEIVLNS